MQISPLSNSNQIMASHLDLKPEIENQEFKEPGLILEIYSFKHKKAIIIACLIGLLIVLVSITLGLLYVFESE